MALIVIRSMTKKKALNALADLERHAKLDIVGKPKKVSLDSIYDVTKRVIKQKPRADIKTAILVKVRQNTTKSIMNIKKIHPPAHIIVVSEEYPEYKILSNTFDKSPVFDGYYSLKSKEN